MLNFEGAARYSDHMARCFVFVGQPCDPYPRPWREESIWTRDSSISLWPSGTSFGACLSNRLGSQVINQLARCSTAPAAHYAEAQGAESRKGFIHKIKLASKELRESLMWLRYIHRMELARGNDLLKAQDECNQLIAITVKSIQTAQRRSRMLSTSLFVCSLFAILLFS